MIVKTDYFTDIRGAFGRLYCASDFSSVTHRPIAQINHSCTTSVGAIRGMHFQYPPHTEMKFIRCLKGRVWDVVVDLRSKSPTFLRWHAEELSSNNARMIVIPEGCAHGFQALEADSELLYLHTAAYCPASESGLRYDDPRLGIKWPLPVTDLSFRDLSHPLLNHDFFGISL